MKEEKELVLYPNKNGTVKTLIEEAAKHVEFSEDGTHQLRMVTIQGCKIAPGPREDTELERKNNIYYCKKNDFLLLWEALFKMKN